MRKRKMFLTTILFLGVGIVILAATSSHTGAQLNNKTIRSTPRTIRTEGWQIPKGTYTSSDENHTFTLDGVTVKSSPLKLANPVIDYEDYFIYSGDELRITRDKVKVVAIYADSVKGRVFAYEVTYMPYQTDGSSVSGVLDAKFIDNDGDGLFEERIHTAKLPSIPEWVKKL